MKGGFTFDGIDIEDLGLTYAPDNQNTYVYRPSTWQVHEESLDGHDGGYHYGATMKPKDFVLRCIYEEAHLNSGLLTKVFDVFKRNKTAKLVFQKRPWVWYMATVINVDSKQITNVQNGILTITLRSYYPFGRSDVCDLSASQDEHMQNDLQGNTAMLYGTALDLGKDWAADGEITEQKEFLLFNPGAEDAHVAIEVAGDADAGVVISNEDTGEQVTFRALSKALTTGRERYVMQDGLNGKVLLTDGSTS